MLALAGLAPARRCCARSSSCNRSAMASTRESRACTCCSVLVATAVRRRTSARRCAYGAKDGSSVHSMRRDLVRLGLRLEQKKNARARARETLRNACNSVATWSICCESNACESTACWMPVSHLSTSGCISVASPSDIAAAAGAAGASGGCAMTSATDDCRTRPRKQGAPRRR